MSKMSTKPLFIIIISAVLLQLFGHYFATKWLVIDNFLVLWPILRIVIPAMILVYLAFPISVFSYQIPYIDRTTAKVLVCCFIALIGLSIYLGYFADDYLSYYRRGMSLEFLRQTERFERFLIFTLSTLIAWEVFHRGFLLGALRFYFTEKMAMSEHLSNSIAMLFVAVFEAMFHIKKPIYESMPFALASIILSWLTIRTGSLWPALMIHLAIELIFGYSAYVGW